MFFVSAGTYDPTALNPPVCMTQCARWSFRYAAVTEGKFCFCSTRLPTAVVTTDGYCNIPCSDTASASMCGGLNYVRSATSVSTILQLNKCYIIAFLAACSGGSMVGDKGMHSPRHIGPPKPKGAFTQLLSALHRRRRRRMALHGARSAVRRGAVRRRFCCSNRSRFDFAV